MILETKEVGFANMDNLNKLKDNQYNTNNIIQYCNIVANDTISKSNQ